MKKDNNIKNGSIRIIINNDKTVQNNESKPGVADDEQDGKGITSIFDADLTPETQEQYEARKADGEKVRLKKKSHKIPGVSEITDIGSLRDRKFNPVAALGIALFALFWLSLLFVVPYDQFLFTPAWIFSHVQQRFTLLFSLFFGDDKTLAVTVYQYVAVMIAGCALASCGAIFQGAFRNVLAGPSTMGVMSGGSFGLLIYLLLFTENGSNVDIGTESAHADLEAWANRSVLEMYGQQLFVLLGCVLGVTIVITVAMAAGRGKVSPSAMIIAGTVFSTITGNFTMIVQYYMILQDPSDTRIEAMKDMEMGTFSNIVGWQPLVMMGVPILIAAIVVIALSGRLNLLSMGEMEATAMGVDVGFYRNLMIVIGTVFTAMVVSFCGHIGFLGFMIPLIGRKLVGPDLRVLIPVSMLLGPIMLMVVYDIAYFIGLTDYLNVITSSVGSIVMICTLLGKKGGSTSAAH